MKRRQIVLAMILSLLISAVWAFWRTTILRGQSEPFYKGKTIGSSSVSRPSRGEELQTLAADVMEQPPEVVERIKRLFVQ